MQNILPSSVLNKYVCKYFLSVLVADDDDDGFAFSATARGLNK